MNPYAIRVAEEGDAEPWLRSARQPADYCSHNGAEALKAMIEAYWAERGQQVMVSLHNVGFHPAIRAARFDVRSDMLNGKPRLAARGAPRPVEEEVFVEEFDVEGANLAFE